MFLSHSNLSPAPSPCVTPPCSYEPGNQKLLSDYGFAEELTSDQPSFEQLELPSPVSGGPPLVLGSDEAEEVAINALKRHVEVGADGGGGGGGGGGGDGEARGVCSALLAVCRDALQRMGTSEEEDNEAMAMAQAPSPSSGPGDVDAGRWRSILAFRLGQKRHLRHTVESLERLLEETPGSLRSSDIRASLRALRSESKSAPPL